jgi:UPF0176 protein
MPPTHRRRPIIVSLHRRLVPVTSAGALLTVAIVACSHPVSSPHAADSSPAGPAGDGPATVAPAPVMPQPVADGPCRYLSAASVQAANGQRVTAVRVSETGPDRPYPACFFFTGDGAVQLRTWIVVTTPAAAHAVIDAVAPVATSDLAELPGGWSGGSQPTPDGAVFAVARQGTAVVITTNQHQTISARQIADQVITALKL